MKKKIFDRRGAGIELAILMMVVSFSMSILLTSVALIQSTKKVRAEERLQQSIALEQLGQDFLSAVLKGDVDGWQPGQYDGFEIVHKHKCEGYTINKEATCTENGEKTCECACGATWSEDIQCIPHNKNESNIKENATCTKEGTIEYECSCGEKWVESISMIPHNWQDVTDGPDEGMENDTIDKEVNETEPEFVVELGCSVNKKQNCSVCGIFNHSWNEGVVTTEPSCENPGIKTYTCDCTETAIEYIQANGHNWTDNGCEDCGAPRPSGKYTLTVYEVGDNTLDVQVTMPSDSITEDIPADDEADGADDAETIEGEVVLKIVLHCDELTNTYKITEWTKNDRR